jgi:N-acetylmuramoyl-L-alanine amidase CwlA
MYDIKVDLIDGLPQEPYRNGVGMWEGVCMHDTECKGDSDESETQYFKDNWKTRQAFVHAFCDGDSITQNAKWEYKSWGCGNGNSRYCNLELANGDNFKEAYNRWIWLAASKLFERKLGVIDGVTLVSHKWVSCHLGGTDHTDPDGFLNANGKTWGNVVNDVLYLYNCMTSWGKTSTPTTPFTTVPATQPIVKPVQPSQPTPSTTAYNPQFIKERVYAKNGKLVRCDEDYKTLATDVRWCKFDKNKIKLDFVYEKGAKVSDIVKNYKNGNVLYGINFPFFWCGVPIADCEDNDIVINAAYGNQLTWHDFASIGGKPFIGKVDLKQQQDFVVQASPMLIEDGKLVYAYYSWIEKTAPDIANSRAQRTAVGLTAEGDLIVVISDGRTKSDQGLNLEELSLFLLGKGAIQSLNGDGGSSTILIDKDSRGLNQAENTGENERPVNHAVVICSIL